MLNPRKLVILISILLGSCYGAGNVGTICTLQPNLKSEFMLRMIDSMQFQGENRLTDNELKEYFDLERIGNRTKLIYFDESPVEVYKVSFTFATSVEYLYNLETNKYYGSESKIMKKEGQRITSRLLDFLKKLQKKGENLKITKDEMYIDYNECGNSI